MRKENWTDKQHLATVFNLCSAEQENTDILKENTNKCTSGIYFLCHLFAPTCFCRLIRPSSACSTLKEYNSL